MLDKKNLMEGRWYRACRFVFVNAMQPAVLRSILGPDNKGADDGGEPERPSEGVGDISGQVLLAGEITIITFSVFWGYVSDKV